MFFLSKKYVFLFFCLKKSYYVKDLGINKRILF
jgi:hypothetical protein